MAICDIDRAALAAAERELAAQGARCLALHCDVSSSEQVERMFGEVVARFGILHVLVNIASTAAISSYSAHSPHYTATKGAVAAFTRAVALDVAGANILVNAIASGGVRTPDFEARCAARPDLSRSPRCRYRRYEKSISYNEMVIPGLVPT